MKYIIYILFISVSILPLQAQKFTAFVNKNKVNTGETIQLTFRLEGANGGDISYPDLGQFRVLGGPNRSQTMQIINGQMSQSVSYSFFLRADKEGSYTIGKASMVIEGKTLTTNTIALEVLKGSSQSVASNVQKSPDADQSQGQPGADVLDQIRQSVFVRAIPNKTKVFEGEQLSITYKLYTRAGVQLADLSLSESPAYNNFWVEDLDVGQSQYTQEVYKGVNYNTAIIKKVILFPQRSGKLGVDPLKLETLVRVRVKSNRRKSIFDDFFDDPFFGNYRDIPYEFSSGSLNVQVKALPSAGKPSAANIPVGQFKMSTDLDNNETETGEPVTLSIKISGQGNIKTLPEFELDFPPDFEVYDPKVKDNVSTSGSIVSGSKSFDYLIVPRNPGEYKLPTVNFHFYDPKKNRYQTLQSDSYVLKVSGEAQQSTMNVANIGKEDIELIGEDIRFIKTADTSLDKRNSSFMGSTGFFLLFGLPFLLFGLLLFNRSRMEKMASDVAGTRSKKANRLAKRKLKIAKEKMEANEQRAFFDEISKALWGYVGDKLNKNQSELSREQVKEGLKSKGLPEGILARFEQLIDHCEMALFAPSTVSGNLKDTYQAAESVILDIESNLA